MKNSCVIGAGIVGIATALSLQKSGRHVTLIDRLGPGEGTSSGNAGIISTGSLFPEAMPGLWRELPGMILGNLAPVTIRFGYLPRLLPWLIRFLANSTEARSSQAMQAIAALSRVAVDYYDPLIRDTEAESLLQRRGMYYVYESRSAFAHACELCRSRDRLGSRYQIVSGQGLREVEPSVREGLAGALFIPGAAFTVSPLALCRQLFHSFLHNGGIFQHGEVSGFRTATDRVTALFVNGDLANGELLADEVFVTAGAWSRSLAKQLGSRVPLETERGYHLMLPDPQLEVRNSMLFEERAIGITPMQDGLRLAGTVEFAGLNARPDFKRAKVLGISARELLPGLQSEGAVPWMGFRPSVPDSVPVISASPHFRNIFFGFGHGHLGLTQAAITGALLTAIADGTETAIDIQPYRIDRKWW